MLHQTRWTLAGIFGIAEEQIRILSPFVGGGFGGKGLWSHQILAIAAAQLAGRPVRVALSREGVFRIAGGRTTTEQRVALGANADGTLAALIHTGIVAMTTHNNCPEQFTFPARHLYAAETILLEQRVADMDMLANTFMRAPGESVGTFALETALDELAEAMGSTRSSCAAGWSRSRDPTSGLPFSSRHMLAALRTGAERFGWAQRNPAPRSRREGEWLIGMGVATATYPYYRMPGGAARITLTRDGHARVQMASHEMGMGTATVQAQAGADRLGLPVEHVTFEYGDTDAAARHRRRRLVADRLHRRRGRRRQRRTDRRAAEARRQRLAAGRPVRGRGGGARRRPRPPDAGDGSRATPPSWRAPAGRRCRRRPTRRSRWKCRTIPCTRTARSSARSGSTPSPGRCGCRASSARSTPAAS